MSLPNHRFGVAASYAILGCLVLCASIIIWFTVHAYTEIAAIDESIASTGRYILE